MIENAKITYKFYYKKKNKIYLVVGNAGYNRPIRLSIITFGINIYLNAINIV